MPKVIRFPAYANQIEEHEKVFFFYMHTEVEDGCRRDVCKTKSIWMCSTFSVYSHSVNIEFNPLERLFSWKLG